jgi:hypothetical protein
VSNRLEDFTAARLLRHDVGANGGPCMVASCRLGPQERLPPRARA